MKAVDTNILVRFITVDDVAQARVAGSVLRAGAFVTSGVLIETEWVLRSFYRMERESIANAFANLLRIEGLEFDDPGGLCWAVERFRDGADWADMVHLVDARTKSAFVTFDADLAKRAGERALPPVEPLTA